MSLNRFQNPSRHLRSLKQKMFRPTIVGRIRAVRVQILSLNKVIRDCIALLIIGHLLTEVSSLLYDIWPKWGDTEVYWFLCPWYHMKMERKWYIKMAADDLLWVIVFYCFAKVAKQYSEYLFLAVFVLFCYHLVDLFFFWWNFKTSHYIYWDMLGTALLLIKGILKGYKPETISKVKSLF